MPSKGIYLLIFVAIVLNIGLISGYANYCDKSLCRDNRQHIGCISNGRNSPACGNNVQTVRFGGPQIKQMLTKTNEVRNSIAGGAYKLPKAVRMRAVVWDQELAELATLHTKTCRMAHDKCRNTRAYKYSGQNIFMVSANFLPNINEVINLAVKRWAAEVKNLEDSELKSYPSQKKPPKKAIGHFTVLVNDRVTAIGCGYTTWTEDRTFKVILTCNYASNNLVGYPTYKQGQVAGSKCKKMHKTWKNLCAKNEDIDPNNITK